MVVGITGRIGSGKSGVTSIFKKNGFTLIEVDRLAHSLLLREEIKRKIRDTFGNEPFVRDEIDRSVLGKIVLASKDRFDKYNSIIHPPLIRYLKKMIKKKGKTANLAVDCALIFEWGIEGLFDYIVLVRCTEKLCIERALKTDKTEDFIIKILSVQLPDEVKISKSDFIIDNTHNLAELKKITLNVIQSIKSSMADHRRL